ncbi:unnamed protein product [Prunus armeniaca]
MWEFCATKYVLCAKKSCATKYLFVAQKLVFFKYELRHGKDRKLRISAFAAAASASARNSLHLVEIFCVISGWWRTIEKMGRHGKSSIERFPSLLLISEMLDWDLPLTDSIHTGFPYNLPPWKCMKKEYMMMTVLITEDPGRSIDVYLRPLVDELKDLWTNDVRTFDKLTGKMFTLRAAVMWTMNDFPAYAMVSGLSTKGYMTCPVCKEDVTSGWHARKVCYLGHRRWLSWDHEWRTKDKEFDGNIERRLRPREWSGDEILEQFNRLDFAPFGKTVKTLRKTDINQLRHVMIPIERLLGELKKTVCNRTKPEGSIIEAWVQYESLTFCGMYLKDVETTFNRLQCNNDESVRNEKLSVFVQSARPFGDPARGESFSRNDMEVAY